MILITNHIKSDRIDHKQVHPINEPRLLLQMNDIDAEQVGQPLLANLKNK